jgi:hypothetical protein
MFLVFVCYATLFMLSLMSEANLKNLKEEIAFLRGLARNKVVDLRAFTLCAAKILWNDWLLFYCTQLRITIKKQNSTTQATVFLFIEPTTMNEALLQFIWRYSLYHPAGLKTTAGEPVTVVAPGQLNTDAGPDFTGGRIRIGSTLLVGNMELHVHSSDWHKHKHPHDKSYQNLILHVVYIDDLPMPVLPHIPTLVLAPHISEAVIKRYANLLGTKQPIPCQNQLADIDTFLKESRLARMLAERWEHKLEAWKDLLDASHGNWSELLYWRLAANFGFKTNATPFLMLARSLPLKVLLRYRHAALPIEALLFGQAGMLENTFTDAHPNQLQETYRYLRRKHNLQPINGHLWKFLRLRPANFPTIRIAQFAALMQQSAHLFAQLMQAASLPEIKPLFQVKADSYWDNHYRPDETHPKPYPKHIGIASQENIVINTIAPIQFLYARQTGNLEKQEKALSLLDSIPPEKNNIISTWAACGWPARNAADTQALLQQYNAYCSGKKCLECNLGLHLIRRQPL